MGLKIVSASLVTMLSVSAVMAEVPSWEEFAGQIFIVRQHRDPGYDGPHPDAGLWLFDPQTAASREARPLDVADSIDMPSEGVSLATWGDSVLVQRFWTGYEFELPSFRLLRTFDTMPQNTAWGWVLHGSGIDPQEADAVGLEPGHYGFLSCVFTGTLLWSGYDSCGELGFPPLDLGTLEEQATLLVFRDHEANAGEFEVVAELSEFGGDLHGPDRLSLSPDPHRGGLWRTRSQSMELLKADGAGGLISYVERSFPDELFPSQHGLVYGAHFHPASDTVFASVWDLGLSTLRFVGLDPDTFEVDRVYDVWDQGSGTSYTRIPRWMASLAPSPPVEKLQTVPIVVDAPGRNGTRWRTTLWLYNPSAEPVAVELSRVTTEQPRHTVELPGHGSMAIHEPLGLLGGGSLGDGTTHDAIQVRSAYRFAENVVAAARVWTGDDAGTFGQAVPAVPDAVGYSNHETIGNHWSEYHSEAWVVLDRRQPGRFRHNLGVVNPSDEPLQVALRWGYHPLGPLPHIVSILPTASLQVVEVAPHSVRLLHLEGLFPQEIVEGFPPQVSIRASDQAIVWLSMVDNLTGDATFLPYTLRWLYSWEFGEVAIPAVAHTPGVGGVTWRTDLYGVTDSFDPDYPSAVFHPATDDVCGGYGPGDEIGQVLVGEMPMPVEDWVETLIENGLSGYYPDLRFRSVFPDVIRKLSDCEDEEHVRGGLHLPASSWTSMFSRTYVERADGGTYGGMLPMYPHGGWPVQYFAGIEVSNDFRINLGLYNADAEHRIVHRLTLHAADGSVAAEAEVTLRPLEGDIRSLARWLGVDHLPHGTYGLTVLPLDDIMLGVEGRSWAFVSMIDNRTGDPTNWW